MSLPITERSQRAITVRELHALKAGSPVIFDPSVHLSYHPPSEIHTMESIGLKNEGVSPFAMSEAFSFFTEEAVDIMRSEIMASEVLKQHSFTSNLAPHQLRGYASTLAPFTYAAWTHPSTLKIISEIAGIDLVVCIDYEIGHVNFSVPGKNRRLEGAENEKAAVVGWHKDSYPFVCVLMLSDTKNMIGGETVLKTGYNTTIKIPGPKKGFATVIQGRYITHAALPAVGNVERITMVTSYRPRSPFIRDDSRLITVAPVSHLPTLYGEFAEYQLENMGARLMKMKVELGKGKGDGGFDVKALKEFIKFEMRQLKALDEAIVEEGTVKEGAVAGRALL